jgi:hypothetical protein
MKTISPRQHSIAVDDRPAAGPQLTAAAGEDGKVICVLEVCAPGEVAMMYGGGQVGGGGVRDAPV